MIGDDLKGTYKKDMLESYELGKRHATKCIVGAIRNADSGSGEKLTLSECADLIEAFTKDKE